MASKRLCFVALCLLALVAPSFQAGTIYADFLTPVREDATYFEGISSTSATVSGAEVGTLKSGHREGFFIESDGPIVSNTGSVTINAAQLIDFTGHSETGSSTVSSAGTISMTGSHLDVDAGTFTGSGNAGSVSSDGTLLFQGGEMTIGNGNGSILFNATENDLSFGAAQGFSITGNDGNIAFENGVAFASDIGGTSFTAVQGLSLEGNLVDIRSQNGATIQTTGSQTYTAGSIVELRSDDEVALAASGDLSVSATNSFIEIDAASAAAFTAASDLSVSAGAISVTNEGSSESVFELTFSDDIVFNADTTANFATFGSGDIGMEGANSVDLSAQDDVTITVREVLDISSDGADVDISGAEVNLSSALKNFTMTGDGGVSFASTGSTIDLSDDSAIVANSQGGSIMATLGDISVNSSDFRFEQIDHNEQNSGDLTVNINGDFADDNVDTEFFSAGSTSFLAGSGSTGDLTFSADDFDISSRTGPNDISFNANTGDFLMDVAGDVNVVSIESRFTISNSLNIIASDAQFLVDNVNELALEAGTIEMSSEEADVEAREVLTILGVAGGVSFPASDVDIDAQELEVAAGSSFEVNASDAEFSANISINLEAEGQVEFDTTDFDLSYQKTLTVTADAIEFDVSDDLDVDADEVYFVSNFPNDRFALDATTVDFNAGFGTVVSGGDLIIDATTTDIQVDDLDLTGFDEISITANTGNLDAVNDLSFVSAGAVEIDTDTSAYTFASLNISPSPDAGDLGDGVLLFDADTVTINSADYDETALTGDILVSADAYTATTTSSYTVTATNSWAFTAGNTLTHVSTGDFTFTAELGATTQSVDYSVTATGDIDFNNLSDTSITSDNFDFRGTTSVDLTMDNIHVQASDLDITVGQDFTVQAVGDINYLADNQLTFTTGNNIDKLVGGDYNVRGDNSVTITDTTITYTGNDMVVNGVDFTTIDSEDDVVVNVTEDGEFYADLIYVRAGGDMTFEALSDAGIMATAHDGEISFHQTGTFNVAAIGATSDSGDVVFDATRNVRTEGELIFQSDGRFDIGLTDSNNPGVFIHTTSMDGNIVFDSTLGDFQASAGSTFTGEANNGIFSLASQAGQATTAQGDINWSAGSDSTFTATGEIDYVTADDFTAIFGSARSNMESEGSVAFIARGTTDGVGEVVTQITVGEDMTMSTSENGGLDIHSDQDLSFTASREAAFVSTDLFEVLVDEAVLFQTTGGDIDVFTTGGPVDFDSDGTHTIASGGNTEITSGRDTIHTADASQTITSDVFTMHSIAGATIIDTGNDDAVYTATNTITIDSQGARTDPRDGVIMTVDGDLTVESTGGEIVLNAFDQVIIGEQTRPQFDLVLGGSPSSPGFTAVSDGAIRFNAGGTFSWEAAGNVDVTTTQEIVMVSDQTLSLVADGTGASSDLRVQATNGNVHFHADGHTGVSSDTMTLTSTTGNFKITGKSRVPGSQLLFNGDTDIESRSFLSNSGLLQSTVTSDLTIDGISAFTIASAVGSVGTVEIVSNGGDVIVGATADFEVRSLKNDGGINLSGDGDLAMETLTSGDIIFDASSNNSRGLLEINAALANTISSVNSFTITANNPAHDDLRNGDIYIFSFDDIVNFSSNDQMEFQTSENFEIYVSDSLSVDADQDISFISSEDMIFHSQGGGFMLTTLGDVETSNSPESGGDLILHAGSPSDVVSIGADQEMLLITGADWIGASDNFVITGTGDDSLDHFGVRIQTEAVGGDIDFISNNFMSLTAVDQLTATTLSGDIRLASGLDSQWFADTLEFVTTDTNMGGGDIDFTSLLGDVRVVGFDDHSVIEVFSSGEDGQAGRMHFEANGISPTSESGISMSANVGSLVIASRGNSTTEGNTVSFVAEEKFDLELNGVFAYFGALDHDFVDFIFNPYTPYSGYNQNLFNQDPEQQVTSIETHGLDADIRFSSRESRDGPGVIHIVTGLVDALGFQLENYYVDGRDAQLTIIADGGSDAEIRFDVESGIIFRGVSSPLNYYISQQNSNNYGSYLPESDANFVTTDPNADIELRTDENAQEARVHVRANDVLFQSQDRSWYGTTGDYGGSVNLITEQGDTRFTTRNNIDTDASPGIAINAYDSKIHISAEFDHAVNFEAVRNINVRADKGYLIGAENLALNAGNLNIHSDTGDINWNSDFHQYTVTDTITFTTSDPTDLASIRDVPGGDIKFRTFDDLSLSADPNTGLITVSSSGGGNIVVHFGSFLEVQGDTTVFGAMTFPMTQEDIRPGSFCNNLFQDNEIIIVKQPLNAIYGRGLESKFGVTLCLCNRETASYSCMNMGQFA